ncbi:hypothetical protein GE061_001787 [Apolygus lucorum]|uniref:protein-histidine N-methyltransferase n=1 Tax=Apolygus lucorum TaxID=248454 RepID=A0A6A4JBR9_APOLU|nr:hypothetical protein GE061_001787 [Apolygus lucorum]
MSSRHVEGMKCTLNMFTFNFGCIDKSQATQGESAVQNAVPVAQQIPSKVQIDKECIKNPITVKVEDMEVRLVDPYDVVNHLKTSELKDLVALQADRAHSDLIPGVYEGGMKIWESTFDLGSLVLKKVPNIFDNKSTLDLGCGSGVLGILALKMGSKSVHFHDYNSEVLSLVTIPNVSLNDENSLDRCQFWSGDWESYDQVDNTRFDLILTSETIYNAKNHKKLHDVIKSKLNPGGAAYVAGKMYYFGVGGSMKGFRQTVENEKIFDVTSIWVSEEGVKREILLLEHTKAS